MNHSFLLISSTAEDEWIPVLQRALAPMGGLRVVPEAQAGRVAADNRYDIVMLDAGCVPDVPALVSRLRAGRAGLRVIVFTASPTWQRARDAFQAGAADYCRKSLNERQVGSLVEAVLNRPAPGSAA